MRFFSGFFAAALFTITVCMAPQGFAQTATPPPTPPAPVKCALDEYPEAANGTTTCKKVPSCGKNGEAISYDATTNKFTCKKLLKCDPKHQQAAYVNGKNVCIDIPDCEKQGKNYAFDGTKMVCQ